MASGDSNSNSSDEDDDSSVDDDLISDTPCSSSNAGEADLSNLPNEFLGRTIKRHHEPSLHIETAPTQPGNPNEESSLREKPRINISHDNSKDPPTPWGDKCTDKKKIVAALKDSTNDIHLYIGDYTEKSFKNVNFKQLHKVYASRYPFSRFRPNFISILKHKLNGTGPFREENPETATEPWKTRSTRSKGWNLLYGILMDPVTNAEALTLSIDELWNSNQNFNCYPKADFQKYFKEMKAMTEKARAAIEVDEKLFEEDMKNFPPSKTTKNGEKFWYNHAARSFLSEDLQNEWAYDMKPAALRLTRKEYQEFTPLTFRKHVHQEKERQRAAPYWRHKRNIAAQKKISEERAEMKRQWAIDRMTVDLGKLKPFQSD